MNYVYPILIVAAFAVGCFVGANNPQWFVRNSAKLITIGQKMMKNVPFSPQ